MSTDAPLKSRHREVLHTIVREYIETGEPVASRTIAKCRHDDLSPASIRNVMADLADAGYLSQPHTSAGRVPTEKAFRFYVRALAAGRIALGEAERLRQEFAELPTVAERVERSSHVLTQLTRHVGIAAAIPDLTRELDQVELVPLADQRVLIILATRDHLVHNRVVTLDEPIPHSDLVSIRNYVNRNFSGWQIGAARRELIRRALEERELYDTLQRHLQVLYQKGLFEVEAAPAVHMEGASNLLGLDLHITRERLQDLLQALEEKQRLIELLDRFLGLPPGELEVHVGLEQLHPAMRDLALVGMSVRMPSGLPAKVAVLGHMRMHYERVMAAVIHTSRALEAAQF
jgi:heat-inducible transcriptional repressor